MRAPSSRETGILLGGCLLLGLLGFSPWGLWERDEGRYADAAREMLERRDFVTPRIDGAVFLDKPPLVYWVTAASLTLWGRSETGARFGQLLFATGVLLVTRRIGILLWDRRRAGSALLALASSLLFFASSHILTLDMGLAFFVSLALLCFLKGYRSGESGAPAYLGMFAAAGGAVLTKGPIGAVLPALTVACFLIPRGEWRRAREFPWLRGVLLFAAIVAPWFVAVSAANPEFVRYFFVHEHLERFATGVHRHGGAWWYYLAVLGAGLMPWSLLLPAHLVRYRSELRRLTGDLSAEAPAFLWAWLAPGLVLFSLSQSKLPFYVVPLLPAAALLLAPMIERAQMDAARRPTLLWPSSILLIGAFGWVVLRHGSEEWTFLRRAGIGWPLVASVAVLAGGAVLLGYTLARNGRRVGALLTTTFLWMAACYSIFAVIGRSGFLNHTRRFASVLAAEALASEPVYAYRCYLRGLPFYLNETVGLVSPHTDDLRLAKVTRHDAATFREESDLVADFQGAGRVFVVSRRRDLQELQRRVARPLFILERSLDHDLVSNHLGAGSSRRLRDLLETGGAGLEADLERAARLVPGGKVTMIAIALVAGRPIVVLSMQSAGAAHEVSFPIGRPADATVETGDRGCDEEEDRTVCLLRLATSSLQAAEAGRLLRTCIGG